MKVAKVAHSPTQSTISFFNLYLLIYFLSLIFNEISEYFVKILNTCVK